MWFTLPSIVYIPKGKKTAVMEPTKKERIRHWLERENQKEESETMQPQVHDAQQEKVEYKKDWKFGDLWKRIQLRIEEQMQHEKN